MDEDMLVRAVVTDAERAAANLTYGSADRFGGCLHKKTPFISDGIVSHFMSIACEWYLIQTSTE